MKLTIDTHCGAVPVTQAIELHTANNTQLYTARAYCWRSFFESNTNQFGQRYAGGRDQSWADAARVIEDEMIQRGLDPKDKSYKYTVILPEDNCVLCHTGTLVGR